MVDPASLYGINKGAAIVLPNNSALQILQRGLQQRELQRQKEDALAQAQLQKLDYNKTREPDQEQFAKDYQSIQNTYSQLRGTTDPLQRMRLSNALQAQQKEFMHKVSLSQQTLENEKFLRQHGITNADKVKDDYNKQLQDLTGTTIFGPDYEKKAGYFNDPNAPKYDFNQFEKTELLPGSLTRVKDYGKNVKQRIGNYTGIAQIEGEDLDKDKLKANITKKVLNDPMAAKALLKQYSGSDITGAIDQYANQVYENNKQNYGQKLKHIGGQFDERPDRFYEHYNYSLLHPRSNAQPNQLSPAQTLVTNMKDQVPGSGEKLLNLIPAGQYGGAKPHIGIDKNTGDHVFSFPAQVQIDKKAVEFNNVIKKDWIADNGNKPMDADALAELKPEKVVKADAKVYRINPASDDYHAQVAQMAKDQNINFTQLNQIEGAKGGKGQIAPVTSHSQQPKSSGKVISPQTVKSLVGKKGYEGYSEKELIDYYKSLGYTIK